MNGKEIKLIMNFITQINTLLTYTKQQNIEDFSPSMIQITLGIYSIENLVEIFLDLIK